jgi:hypothetical protein
MVTVGVILFHTRSHLLVWCRQNAHVEAIHAIGRNAFFLFALICTFINYAWGIWQNSCSKYSHTRDEHIHYIIGKAHFFVLYWHMIVMIGFCVVFRGEKILYVNGNEKWSNLSIQWYTDVKTDLFFCYQQCRRKRLRHDHPQERINFRSTYIRRRMNNRREGKKNWEKKRKSRSMKTMLLNGVFSNNFYNIYMQHKNKNTIRSITFCYVYNNYLR